MVHKERFSASSWVDSHKWVNPLNVLWTSSSIVAIKMRVSTQVNGLPPNYNLAKFQRELAIGGIPRSPESVTSYRWNCIIVQVCYTRWMLRAQDFCYLSALLSQTSAVPTYPTLIVHRPVRRKLFSFLPKELAK